MSRNPNKKDGGKTQEWMARSLDDLSDFEKYKNEIAPKIRKLVEGGASAKEIMEFAQSYAAARMVSVIFSADDSKAIVAAKDVIDRAAGKATENKKVTHQFEELKDEELDAVLLSKLKQHELDADDDTGAH